MTQKLATQKSIRLVLQKHLFATTAMTVASVLASTSAYAVDVNETPTGGVVVGGSSTISYGGANNQNLNVLQTTQQSVINWNSFNLGKDASATYVQPNANSLSVNRVTGAGNDPSKIYGTLSSNGRIMILDANGVLFGASAKVDVGGIIATTGTLDADNQNKLMAGQGFTINNIDKNAEAKIENQGVINVADGGLAAFVAPWVANSGAINAKLGSVTLAAGQKLTVDLAGDNLISIAVTDKLEKALVENSGAIDAAGGNVTISANAAKGLVDEVINMSGVVKANSFSQKGGKIVLSGGGGKVKVTGKLDASGKTGGGSIDVRGQDIDVGVGAELNADATSTGNGGSAVVFANNTAIINGRLSAKGGALQGNGGFIETSGFNLGVSELASVDASAANGLAGTWLLDPLSIVISNGTGATTNVDGRDYANVNAGGLSTALSGGTNVTVETGVNSAWSLLAGQFFAADDNDGDIRVRSSITHSGSAASTLTLIAHDDITIENGADITATGTGKLGVSLNARGEGLLTLGDINVATGSVISTKGGDVSFNAENNITIDEDITTAGGNIALTSGGILAIQSGDDVDAGTGNVTVKTDGLSLNGALKAKAVNISRATFDGRISLGAGNGGLEISNAELGRITTDTLTIGTAGTGSKDNDIYVDGAAFGATKTILNTMRNDSGSNEGVVFAGSTTSKALEVNADDDITFKKNASLNATGNVALNANTNNLSDGDLHLGVNAKIDTNGKNLTSTALNTVLDDGAKIDAEGGNVSLYNTKLFKSDDANSVSTTGTGTISLNQNNGGSIQNAIDAVNNTGSGLNTITVGAGTYHESVSVTENNFLIKGKNYGIAGNGVRSAESIVDGNGTSNFGFKITSDNVTIDGFEIKGITGAGIKLDAGTDKITLANNYIHNIAGDGIYAMYVDHANITRNKITDITSTADLNGSGIQLHSSYNTTVGGASVADANVISNTGWDGVRLEGGGYLSVKNNNIQNVARSGIFAGGVSSFTLANNIINGTTNHYGIDVSNGWDASVLNNDIDNTNLDGISMYGTGLRAARANVIMGNSVDGSKASGITVNTVTKANVIGNFVGLSGGVDNIGVNGVQVLSSTGAIVKGNTVTETKGNGIYTNAAIDTQIGGASSTDSDANKVYGTNANGISINGGSGNKVTGNDVSATTQDGIALNTTANVTVSANNVHDLAGRGIYATGLSKNATGENFISGNYVDSIGNNGIHLAGSNKYVNITGNFIGLAKDSTINGDGIYGINLENSMIKGNTITNTLHTAGNNGSGIQLLYAYNTDIGGASSTDADANHIYGTGWDGVRVEGGGNLKVQGNDIQDVTRTGVFGGNVDNLAVANNVINGANEKYGVDISGGWKVSVTNNDINDTFLDGISIYGTTDFRPNNTYTVSGNHVDTTGGSGIVLNNVVSGAASGVVTGNFVGLNGGEDNIGVDGVQVLSSSGIVVTANQISNTFGNGIYTNASSNLQIGGYNAGELNTVSYDGANGISVNGGYNNDIVKNDIRYSTADGIHAAGSNDLLIDDNEVHNSGDDGIDVSGAYGEVYASRNTLEENSEETSDEVEATVYNVNIINNNVENSYNHGINVSDSDSVNVYNNDVTNSGHYDWWWGTGNGINTNNVSNLNIDTNRLYSSIGSGIVVNNGGDTDITGNTVTNNGYDGIYAYNVYNLNIQGNGVTGGNDSGIEVNSSEGAQIIGNTVNDFYNGIRVYSYGSEVRKQDGTLTTLISGNFIGLTPTKEEPTDETDAAKKELSSTISSIQNDGIQVQGVSNVDIIDNEVRNFGGDGIEVSYSGNVLIDNNRIYGGEGTTGIRLGSGYNYSNDNTGCGSIGRCSGEDVFAVVMDNDETSGTFQVSVNQFSGNDMVTVTNNTVDDNFVGIDAQAANNGGIVLTGNTFTDNTVGGWISSGHIDLTGASNTFNGGDTALRFQAYTQPIDIGGDDGEEEGNQPTISTKSIYEGDYTDLTLEGDTLGTTIFNGQSTYYVELLNGSFFNPGTPTVIDGRFASFDGFTPGTGTIDATKLAAIEAMINDFDDNKTLGQIFVGFSPADLDDNDIMKKIFGNNYKPGKGSITILGLPTTTSTPGTFTDQELANIAPAAGGNDNAPTNVEPAAGEATEGCWSAVAGAGGPTVNMSMSEEPSDVLAAQSACGGTDI